MTARLRATPGGIRAAAELLQGGGVVALPTETVYGLAANALDAEAVRAVFAAKGRPADNPLIVHVARPEDANALVMEIPDAARKLMDAFWPGPLTLVLNAAPVVPQIVTAGLPTVAVRCPAHPVTRAVIEACGFPLAAPSANLSGRPSPTRAAHVLDDLDGLIDAVLDGGECPVGVESTVLDLTVRRPCILRPGAVTRGMAEAALGQTVLEETPRDAPAPNSAPAPKAPGMKYRHYAPRAPVFLCDASEAPRGRGDVVILCFDGDMGKFDGPNNFSFGSESDPETAMRRLYALLRQADALNPEGIYVVNCPRGGEFTAFRDRLSRAAHNPPPVVHCQLIGVTGPSGAGKSAVLGIMEKQGVRVIDADKVYHELLATDTRLVERVASRFPKAAVRAAGRLSVDRKALADIVFADPRALKELEAAVHPAIMERVRELLAGYAKSGAETVAVEAIALIESGMAAQCDYVIAVLSEENAARVRARDGLSGDGAARRLAAQKDGSFYAAAAHFTIDNNGGEDALEREVRAVLKKIKEGRTDAK